MSKKSTRYFGIAMGHIVTAMEPDVVSINARVIAVVDENAQEKARELVDQANTQPALLAAMKELMASGYVDSMGFMIRDAEAFNTACKNIAAAIAKAEAA